MAVHRQSDLQQRNPLEPGLTQQPLGMTVQNQQGDGVLDPVEAYFECITTCSLDDGECITVCTELLREQV